MALPWIHPWADLIQKSVQMCMGNEYFIPTKIFEERDPVTYFYPAPDPPLGRSGLKQ